MASLVNTHADMEIGYVQVGGKKQLFVQIGKTREYYGYLIAGKADKFMKMLEKWDENGGNDNGTN